VIEKAKKKLALGIEKNNLSMAEIVNETRIVRNNQRSSF
jgi:hypothetical protein